MMFKKFNEEETSGFSGQKRASGAVFFHPVCYGP